MSKFYLCSFADSNMCISAFRFKNQAKKLRYSMGGGIFDDIFIYNEDSLPLWFKKIFNGKMYGNEELNIDEKYKNWYSKGQIRGFGYWCWKPCVILETLKQIDDGDFLLYLDIGFEFCNGYDDIIKDMLVQVDKNDIMSIKIKNDYLNAKNWNKMDFLNYFGLDKDEEFLNSPQLQAGFICMKKSKKTIDIIKQWMDFFINHFDLVDDTPSKLPNLSTFIEHRHDQSVLTALMYLNNCVNFDKSYYKKGYEGFPFLYNRSKLFLFCDRHNIVSVENSGYIKYNFPLSDARVYVDINVASKFDAMLAMEFKRMYQKKSNFIRKMYRMYIRFPMIMIRKYREYANNDSY